MQLEIKIRNLLESDPELIEAAFKNQGWNKPAQQYRVYLKQQENNERMVFLALANGEFCGYVTIKWCSDYPLFQKRSIPEISDLNVLIKFQRAGVGTMLMHRAEQAIFEKGAISGLGVGLLPDYGAAQRLYNRLGYRPDGFGITYQNKRCEYGVKVCVDDDLVLWMVKAKASNVPET